MNSKLERLHALDDTKLEEVLDFVEFIAEMGVMAST